MLRKPVAFNPPAGRISPRLTYSLLNVVNVVITIVLAFSAFALFIIGLTTLANVLMFPRLGRPPRSLPANRPRLSFLVPARDEVAVIGRTTAALLAQDYPDFEVLILDDHSTDGTAEQAQLAAGGDARFRVLAGQPLPNGWLGKNWACAQLAAAADGDVLVFTDADVMWAAGAAAALVAEMERDAADMLSVWPTQLTETWAERLVVPLLALAILGYLPILPVHIFPWPVFAAANGQCLAFRRLAYLKVGGHSAVAGEVVEDVTLARRIKSSGLRLRLTDGQGFIRCRMYDGWPAVRDGFAKNILAGHGGSMLFLLASTVFHWLVFVLPWLLWAYDWRFALLAAVGVVIRAVTASFTGQRIRDALLMPVSVLLMTAIAARSIRWHVRGGPRWKGRVVRI